MAQYAHLCYDAVECVSSDDSSLPASLLRYVGADGENVDQEPELHLRRPRRREQRDDETRRASSGSESNYAYQGNRSSSSDRGSQESSGAEEKPTGTRSSRSPAFADEVFWASHVVGRDANTTTTANDPAIRRAPRGRTLASGPAAAATRPTGWGTVVAALGLSPDQGTTTAGSAEVTARSAGRFETTRGRSPLDDHQGPLLAPPVCSFLGGASTLSSSCVERGAGSPRASSYGSGASDVGSCSSGGGSSRGRGEEDDALHASAAAADDDDGSEVCGSSERVLAHDARRRLRALEREVETLSKRLFALEKRGLAARVPPHERGSREVELRRRTCRASLSCLPLSDRRLLEAGGGVHPRMRPSPSALPHASSDGILKRNTVPWIAAWARSRSSDVAAAGASAGASATPSVKEQERRVQGETEGGEEHESDEEAENEGLVEDEASNDEDAEEDDEDGDVDVVADAPASSTIALWTSRITSHVESDAPSKSPIADAARAAAKAAAVAATADTRTCASSSRAPHFLVASVASGTTGDAAHASAKAPARATHGSVHNSRGGALVIGGGLHLAGGATACATATASSAVGSSNEPLLLTGTATSASSAFPFSVSSLLPVSSSSSNAESKPRSSDSPPLVAASIAELTRGGRSQQGLRDCNGRTVVGGGEETLAVGPDPSGAFRERAHRLLHRSCQRVSLADDGDNDDEKYVGAARTEGAGFITVSTASAAEIDVSRSHTATIASRADSHASAYLDVLLHDRASSSSPRQLEELEQQRLQGKPLPESSPVEFRHFLNTTYSYELAERQARELQRLPPERTIGFSSPAGAPLRANGQRIDEAQGANLIRRRGDAGGCVDSGFGDSALWMQFEAELRGVREEVARLKNNPYLVA